MPTAISIDDPDDPRVAGYRHIRERDLVGRQGLFIAEGEVVLRVLLGAAASRPVSILVDRKRFAALEPLLSQAGETPVYAASQAVFDGIAGFHLHRGILALAQRCDTPSAEALLARAGERAMVLCLSAISNHDNMGGIFRNAAAFGADSVLIDAECCDPLYRKAIRVSVGGVLKVPFARLERDEDLPAMLARHGFEAIALSPRGAVRLQDYRRPSRVAALFGSEGEGLAETILSRTTTVRIPMAQGFDSLNVATTSGIVLAQLSA